MVLWGNRANGGRLIGRPPKFVKLKNLEGVASTRCQAGAADRHWATLCLALSESQHQVLSAQRAVEETAFPSYPLSILVLLPLFQSQSYLLPVLALNDQAPALSPVAVHSCDCHLSQVNMITRFPDLLA